MNPGPWCDRTGRLSWFRCAALVLLCAPAGWIAWKYAAGQLGPRPANAAVHETGLWMIRFLFVALAVTPLREGLGLTRLLDVRRMVGVAAFAYGAAHLILYAAQESWRLGFVAAEIVRRIYLLIGFVGLVGLAVLAITSTDGWQRRLRERWRRLHRAVYVIAVLAAVHFFMQSKAEVSEPILMAGLLLWLMAARAWTRLGPRPRGRIGAVALAFLGVAAAVATAAGEALYYFLKVGAGPAMVLEANFRAVGFRPAWGVALAAALVLAVAMARAGWGRISALRVAAEGRGAT